MSNPITSIPSEPAGNSKETAWFRQLLRCIRERTLKVGPGLRLSYKADGALIELVPQVVQAAGESGTLQFRGEWSSKQGYSKGDIVIYGSNNIRGPGPDPPFNAQDILHDGHKAGTYIALQDIPAPDPLESNPPPGEPDTSGQWETFARGAWHYLTVRPLDPTKLDGVTIDGRGDYVAIVIKGGDGAPTCTIDSGGSTVPLKRNAQWVEIDVCDNGVPKKMQVLGTAPYIP